MDSVFQLILLYFVILTEAGIFWHSKVYFNDKTTPNLITPNANSMCVCVCVWCIYKNMWVNKYLGCIYKSMEDTFKDH